MPAKFIIQGAKSLKGQVSIRGSKNTILPLMAACFLTEETCLLEKVPEISDVQTLVEISRAIGAKIEWDRDAHRLAISARELKCGGLPAGPVKKLRGSILFSGALLARFREVRMPYPGGDVIGARPLATHFNALKSLGATIEENEEIAIDGRKMSAGDIILEETSVTATENTILAAVLIPGQTIIRLAAFEPHVQELVLFLKKMGADIRWREYGRIEINGVARLRGAEHVVNPDDLEVSSFATLAAATGSEITLRGIEPNYLDAVFLQLKKMGVAYETRGRDMTITKTAKDALKPFRVQAGLYPKLGSDHLPPFAVLATQARGESLIHEWLYEKRFGYISELQKMGANCRMLDRHRALITGPTPLHGSEISGLDIRSGMTLVIAGLAAQGQTAISGIEHLDRGYERLDERLRAIGADIKRVTS